MRTTAAHLTAILILLSALPLGARAQQSGGVAIPKEAVISIELDDLPGRNSEGSYWEVSYELRIVDQNSFIKWSEGGEDPKAQSNLGVVISKNSFARRNLSRPENLRFRVAVPLTGALLERFRHAGQNKQYVWMDGTVRIHDATLGRDFVTKLGPVWGPKRFITGLYNVHVELSPQGELGWSSDNGTAGRRVVTRP